MCLTIWIQYHQHPTSIANTICRAIFPIISICNIDSSWFGSNPELIVKHCDNRQCHNLHNVHHIAISWRLFNVRLTSHRHFLRYKLFRSPLLFFFGLSSSSHSPTRHYHARSASDPNAIAKIRHQYH